VGVICMDVKLTLSMDNLEILVCELIQIDTFCNVVLTRIGVVSELSSSHFVVHKFAFYFA